MQTPAQSETVGGYLDHLCPGVTAGTIPDWPPDAYALAAALLKKSGAYYHVLESNWPPPIPRPNSGSTWAESIRQIGLEWRRSWKKTSATVPAEVAAWWAIITGAQRKLKPLHEACDDQILAHALMQVCACADEASYDVGMIGGDAFKASASGALVPDKVHGSTLCRRVDRSRVRVLPKMHTPQNGLTIRSLSQNVSLCSAEEVVPFWLNAGLSRPGFDDYCVNLLVVPWPEKMRPAQFQATEYPSLDVKKGIGLFTFVSDGVDRAASESVVDLFESARRHVGRIDGVVLPEMALAPPQHRHLVPKIVEQGAFLICGVGDAAKQEAAKGTWK